MRISYPGHDAQQGSATVGISVRGPDGTPLKGAVINGRVTYDGEQPAQMSVDLTGTIDVEITHFGQTVASRALTEDDFDPSGTLPTIEIQADEAGYPPGGFGNSLQAVWLSERNIALAWRGRLTTAGDVLRTSVVTDITQRGLLFNERRLRYDNDNDGLEIYNIIELDSDQGAEGERGYGRSVGVTHVWTSGREDDGYVKIDTLTFESDPEIAAVRLFDSSGAPDGPAQHQRMTKGSHVDTPSSLSLSVGPEMPAAGSKVAVQARAENSDFTPVTWSVSGDVSIVESGTYGCVLEVGENGGSVTATAVNATLTASETINTFESSTLPSPPGLQVSGASQVGEARVSWDDPSSSLVAGTRLSFDGWIWDTTDRSFTIAELPDNTFDAKLRFLNRKGEVGSAASFTLEPGEARNKPAVYQTAGIPEMTLAPGSSIAVDLTQYATPPDGVSWSDLSARVQHLQGESGVTATSGDTSTVVLNLDAAAEATSNVRDIVVVELEDTSGVAARLVQLAFPVARGPSSKRGDALSLGGDSLAAVGGKTAPTGPIVGPDPSVYLEPDWEPDLSSVGRAFELSLGEGTFTLPPGLDGGSAGCAISALKGEKGVSVFCFGLNGPPHFAAPLLPSGSIDQIERPDGYISYSGSLLSPGGGPQRWARALTEGGSLHDLSLLKPPTQVTYKAPLYFQSTWIDEHLYPEDASIDYTGGFVTYRQGLQSPAAVEVSPSIDTLRAEPADGGIDVYWDIKASGTPVNGLVSLTVDDGAGNTFSVDGDGRSEIRGLDPTKTYTVTLLGQTDSVVPGRERPDLGIEAWTRSDLSYSYRYDCPKSPDAFVDHFGTEHSSPTFPIEVTSEKAVREHVVTFKWSGENKEIRAPADWTLPPGGTSIESEVTVGRKLPAGNAAEPTFYRTRYSGGQTVRLPTDFYRPGTWRIEPVGYLPLGLDEELEDYVRVWFVGPGGEDLGPQTTVDAQAELGARAEIQAVNGQSPIIVGARALRLNKNE